MIYDPDFNVYDVVLQEYVKGVCKGTSLGAVSSELEHQTHVFTITRLSAEKYTDIGLEIVDTNSNLFDNMDVYVTCFTRSGPPRKVKYVPNEQLRLITFSGKNIALCVKSKVAKPVDDAKCVIQLSFKPKVNACGRYEFDLRIIKDIKKG